MSIPIISESHVFAKQEGVTQKVEQFEGNNNSISDWNDIHFSVGTTLRPLFAVEDPPVGYSSFKTQRFLKATMSVISIFPSPFVSIRLKASSVG